MKLYGSTTSPYVRRLRILLNDTPYELESVNLFGEDREKIKEVNPTLKIPMLEDTANPDVPVLFDSGLIYRYLVEKYNFQGLSFSEQNWLTVIDACSDSLINVMLMRRSGIDTNKDKMYFNIQRERQKVTFDLLEEEVVKGTFNTWNYLSISLLVLIEWAKFRDLYDFSDLPAINSFVERNQQQNGVSETKPAE